MIRIPEDEIRKRMRKLSNYENIIYPQIKERSSRLREENRKLKKENARLEEENKQIEKLKLQLEELRILKFGKKRTNVKSSTKVIPKNEGAEPETNAEENEKKAGEKKNQRSAESYRRPKPDPKKITDRLRLEIEECPECGEPLVDKKEHIHYREDLYEIEKILENAQRIVETIIESGKCESCKKRQYAMEVPKQNVIIGENLREMVVYMTVIQGQSYTEVQRGLWHQYGMAISSGEVANILEGESLLLTPYYDHLVELLASEKAAHYDETTWKTKDQGREVSEGDYCWVKISVETQNRIIWFGRSRGKGVAEALRGEREGSIGISDDYGAYHDLFAYHQLCWAHPHRKLRDLAESGVMSKKARRVCQKAFKDFANVYKKSEKARKKLLSNEWDEESKAIELKKLKTLFEKLFISTDHDPEKLKTIRETLKKKKEKYFTFFEFPKLPLDNNKAERAMRKIVLKRKKSFGCRSQKGANVLSILYSVVFSIVGQNPDQNFFSLYRLAAEFEGQ